MALPWPGEFGRVALDSPQSQIDWEIATPGTPRYAAVRDTACLREYMSASARAITSLGWSASSSIVIPAEAPTDKLADAWLIFKDAIMFSSASAFARALARV